MRFGAKSAPADIMPPSGPTELGKLLCATRMRLGKDLQRIADILHIRYNYLVAIEDGRYEDLPGQAYAIGFVRAYADHLGLDGDEIVRRYKEESGGVKHKTAFEFQMPTSDSALPSGTLLLIAVIAGMAVYGLWYSMAGSDRTAVELIQEVPDRLAAIADPNEIQAAIPVTAKAPQDVVDGSPHAPEPDASLVQASLPAAEAMVTSVPPASATSPMLIPPAAPQLPLSDVLELRAKADVWITLRDEKAVERTQFLRKDEVLRLPEQGVTTLVTANAGDLDILVNGKAMPPLDAGLFARGVALDPQKLKSASAAPIQAPLGPAPSQAPPATPAAAPSAASPAPAPAPGPAPAVPSAPATPETAKPATEAAKPAATPAPGPTSPASGNPTAQNH
ncbi:MAG: RodZ domain-containing protein [Rhodospirillaceae bacterium]